MDAVVAVVRDVNVSARRNLTLAAQHPLCLRRSKIAGRHSLRLNRRMLLSAERMRLPSTQAQCSGQLPRRSRRAVAVNGPVPRPMLDRSAVIRHLKDCDVRFDAAIDSKLRGCDLVRLRVSGIHLGDSIRLRTTIVQQKTGRPVPFELTEPTRDALASWLRLRGLRGSDWLFSSRSRPDDHLTTRQYGRLLDDWVALSGSIRPPTGPTACAGRRSRSCTSARATSGLANSCSVTNSWRALSETSG